MKFIEVHTVHVQICFLNQGLQAWKALKDYIVSGWSKVDVLGLVVKMCIGVGVVHGCCAI